MALRSHVLSLTAPASIAPRPWTSAALALSAGLAASLATASCINTPDYIGPEQAIEVGIPDPAMPDMQLTQATAQVFLPVRLETADEAMARAAQTADLGVEVSYVSLDDFDIAIEWTIKNLSDEDGTARVQVNGANERFIYVPDLFVIDPDEDEPPPPLIGNVPIEVPAEGVVSGVFREDELREAAIDLELITRGAINPFAAILDYHADVKSFPDEAGAEVPQSAFGHLVQYDIILIGDRHMVLEYNIRIRDQSDLLHPLLLDAPAGELTEFMPVEFVPPPPPPEES
ncbi:MAG: hypothetical protein Tsb0020_32210 [Haliangiales bacterium]